MVRLDCSHEYCRVYLIEISPAETVSPSPRRITPEEVKQRLDAGEDILILDLRDGFEFHEKPQTIPGAFHLSIEELESQHHKIPRDREIVLFCA